WRSCNDAGKEIGGTATFGDLIVIAPYRPFFRTVTQCLSYIVLQWSFVDAQGERAEVLWPTGASPVRDTVRLKATFEQLKPLSRKSDGWSWRRQNHLLEELLHLAWQTRTQRKVTDNAMRHAAEYLRERAGENF